MITSLNSLIFSFDRLSGPLRESKPQFCYDEDMDVEYVYNETNPDQFGIIVNSWFYRVQPDGSLNEETPFAKYNSYSEFTINRIEEYLKISGGYTNTEPESDMCLWFGIGRYHWPLRDMRFKYHGVAYSVTL